MSKAKPKWRFVHVGWYPRKGDQFLYYCPTRWRAADKDLLAEYRGTVPSWYRHRYRRRAK